MTSTIDLGTHQVSLEMSHPTGGGGERRAQLRVFDGPSRLLVLSVEIPPDAFYKLLSGLVDSETLPAFMINPDAYQRVGKQRHHWTRRIGYGVADQAASDWAEEIRQRLGLDTVDIHPRQGGLWATWKLWSNDATKESLDLTKFEIDTAPLPEGAR